MGDVYAAGFTDANRVGYSWSSDRYPVLREMLMAGADAAGAEADEVPRVALCVWVRVPMMP